MHGVGSGAEPEQPMLGAIDAGTNAARLTIAKMTTAGAIETVHAERTVIRPGDDVFDHGVITLEAERRVAAALERFGMLCSSQKVLYRAVATSAFREARNRDEVTARLRRETGVAIEVISSREEARLTCLGALHTAPSTKMSLVIDVGGGSTEVVVAEGCRPVVVWSLRLGGTRLARRAGDVATVRQQVRRELQMRRLTPLRGIRVDSEKHGTASACRCHTSGAIGTSGSIRKVVAFASDGLTQATADQIRNAVPRLEQLGQSGRALLFGSDRAGTIVQSAVIIDELVTCLSLDYIATVSRGVRDGIIVDLSRSQEHAFATPAVLGGAGPRRDASTLEPAGAK